MSGLLNLAMRAHGGLERSKQVRNMQAKVKGTILGQRSCCKSGALYPIHRANEQTRKRRAVACVYPRSVCPVIRMDL
jgi:hypothetical protein